VRDSLIEMRGQSTILLCTHDLEEARQLTSRVAVLYRGRVVETGPTHEVLGGDATLELFRGQAGSAA
jgi:peptide/nickel transport system ATP-binding protein